MNVKIIWIEALWLVLALLAVALMMNEINAPLPASFVVGMLVGGLWPRRVFVFV